MKKITSLIAVFVLAVSITGCATAYPIGSLYQDIKLPITATSNGEGTKVGTAVAESYLGLVAMGDASIETAKKNGGITEVTHVDWDVENILGLYGKYTVTVYGN